MIPLIYQEEVDYLPRTEQIWIKSNDLLFNLCHISKNLYNEANYIIRQEFTKKDKDGNNCGSYIPYIDLYHMTKDNKNFSLLPGQTARQVLMILDRNWKSFFVAIKDWKIHPEKYLGRPKLPGYLKKDGEFALYFTDQQVRVDSDTGKIIFPKTMHFLRGIKTRIKSVIKELRIIPKGKTIGYLVDLVYYKEVKNRSISSAKNHSSELSADKCIKNLNKDNIIGLDFGLRNFVTTGNNVGLKSICIKGGVLKSINQYYNKKLAELKSIYSKQYIIINDKIVQRLTGPAIQILTNNRNKKVKDVMHKYSRSIIDDCIEHNIGTIVIGYNPEWKQEINLGKKTNQNFVQIPFYQFINMIKYKAEEIGISVIEQDESHTSKCSFLDDESVEHHDIYVGKRISRGLFRSAKGIIINADVQGALNTIKKAIPKAFSKEIKGQLKLFVDRIEDAGLHPLRINPLMINRNINVVGN